MQHWQSLIERVPARYTGLRADAETALAIADRFAIKAAEINADPHLSEPGKKARIASEIDKGARDHLGQLRQRNTAALASILAQKKALEPAVSDRADPVAEMRRAEIRTYLRGLPDAERMRMALAGDATIIEAIVDMPAALSGIDESMRRQLVDAYVEKAHGPAAEQLWQDMIAREELGAILTVAERRLAKLVDGEGA